MLDDDAIEEFRSRAAKVGAGYQTMINAALRDVVTGTKDKPITVATLRRVLREELNPT